MFVQDLRFTGSSNGGSNTHPRCLTKPGKKKIPKSNDAKNRNDCHAGNFSLDNVVEDVVVSIFSLLSPSDISACRCVSKRFYKLCSDDRRVWVAMCDRRWGAKTQVRKWGSGKIVYKLLYGILERWENLVGLWRGIGHGGIGPLVSFDWGSCCLIGSKIEPVRAGSYEVRKVPFLWLGLSGECKDLCFIDPDCIPDSAVGKERVVDGGSGVNYGVGSGSGNLSSGSSNLGSGSVGISGLGSGSGNLDSGSSNLGSGSVGISGLGSGSGSLDSGFEGKVVGGSEQRRIRNPFENWEVEVEEDGAMDGLVGVNLNFVGDCHIVVEEKEDRSWLRNSPIGRNRNCWDLSKRVRGFGDEGLSDGLQLGICQYFASKVSLGGRDRSGRKRRRKEKERAGHRRRKWESEHFVKVVDCCPTPARPLQGLWKGITDSMSLEFILVSYDACGGIVCRQVGGYSQYVSGYGSVFWTADSTSFARFSLSAKEEELYNFRTHIRPVDAYQTDSQKCTVFEDVEVTQVLHIDSNSDLYRHGIGVSASNNIEGRLWQYTNGKFGFAFLNSNSIVDFQQIGSSGNLLDIVG